MNTPEQMASALWKELRNSTPTQVLHVIIDLNITMYPSVVIGQPITEATKEYWIEVKKYV